MVKVTYSLFLETQRFVFSETSPSFNPKAGLEYTVSHLLSQAVVVFKDQLTDSWIAIHSDHIKKKGVFQIAKIQEID